jgi:Rrf2 family nitric oxide-sensitive transcriptional repressor
VLLYLAERRNELASTQEISEAYGISKNHLVRVVQSLSAAGFLQVSVGRSGGIRLARNPAEIRLGDVVRRTEPGFQLVECFDGETNTCPIVPVCRLRSVLHDALAAFFAVLDNYTLEDLIRTPNGRNLSQYLKIQAT